MRAIRQTASATIRSAPHSAPPIRNPVVRIGVYTAINLCFALLVVIAGVAYETSEYVSVEYVMSLFALCSLPLLFAERLNGRYLILAIFMVFYFAHFGLNDLLMLLSIYGDLRGLPRQNSALTVTESLILTGAVMLVIGYTLSAAALKNQNARLQERDWNPSTVVVLGLLLWAGGVVAIWISQFGHADLYAKFEMSITSGAILVLLTMLGRLGMLLLLYAYVTSRRAYLALLVSVILLLQFAFGFVADSKTIAIEGLVMLVIARLLVDGRVPKSWLLAGAMIFLLSYSVFQGYRDTLHTRHLSRERALDNISSTFDKALESSARRGGGMQQNLRELSDRLNAKWVVQIIVNKTGTTVAYKGGETLKIFLYAFIPRWIIPDKPETSIGRLVNREFRISESPLTYIAASQLGELYWNFGWTGVIIGMTVIGSILGSVGSLFNLSERRSVLRLLIIVTTIYGLCFRFEGGLGQEYTVWIRSVAIIVLLHLLFRDRRPNVAPRSALRAPVGATFATRGR